MSVLHKSETYKEASQEALDVANKIATSALAVAIVAGLDAGKLAKVLADEDGLAIYRNNVASALQGILVKMAVEQEKEVEK